MTNKRKYFESHNGENALYSKRSRFNDRNGSDELPSSSQPRLDPTYGQRGAFPGLDDCNNDDGLFYGPASDGLEYLRMVRSEAKTVPNLLVAPVSPTVKSSKSELYADYPQGYYSDGAYTAVPHSQSDLRQAHPDSEQQEDQDPQEAYYVSLSARFTKLTETLQSPPSRSAPASTDVSYLDWKGRRLWYGKVLNTAPTMVLLAQLTQESVINGLGVVESLVTFSHLSGHRSKNIGAWAWGLLGRCRGVGQMCSEEVGVLRNVGKQAVWLLRRISAGEMIGGDDDVMDAGVGEEHDVENGEWEEGDGEDGDGGEECAESGAESPDAIDAHDACSPSFGPILQNTSAQNGSSETHSPTTNSDTDVAKAKRRLLDSLGANNQPPDTNPSNDGQDGVRSRTPNTYPVTETTPDGRENPTEGASPDEKKATMMATLDMLVTIIGECYGQRDLLGGRPLWDEM